MSRIPQTFIDDLIARSDIVELIDARVPLRKAGNNYTACCPFHNEKSPSFSVSPTKQFYYCFGCGASGNVIGFLMNYEHMEFIPAIETIASQLGLEIPRDATQKINPHQQDLYTLLEKISQYYQQQLKQHPNAIEYLKQRGLSGEIAKTFNIGYVASGWDHVLREFGTTAYQQQQLAQAGMLIRKESDGYYDRFRERIMFPIRDQRGRVVGFGGRVIGDANPKYLNSPETPIYHKGSELYGLYEALQAYRKLPRLLLVEGYMDVVALAQHGINYAVASLGTSLTAKHLQRVFKHTKELICCFDGDKAGRLAAERSLQVILPQVQDDWKIKFLFLPTGHDPDSLVREEGQVAFEERLSEAQVLSDYLFTYLTKDLDLTLPDDRARLAKSAMPLLQQVPGNYLKPLLLEQLAKLVKMDVNVLTSQSDSPSEVTVQQQPSTSSTKTPVRMVITLLLQHPKLAQIDIDQAKLRQVQLPGMDLFFKLLELLQKQPDLSTGALLEYWRDTPQAEQLAKLAMYNIPFPEEGVSAEFVGLINKLYQIAREQKIDALLAKANQADLNTEEKQQLQSLLMSK